MNNENKKLEKKNMEKKCVTICDKPSIITIKVI